MDKPHQKKRYGVQALQVLAVLIVIAALAVMATPVHLK